MSDIYIVGFDGTEASGRAADLAADLAKTSGATLHLVMVLEWSPYSFLSQEELAERHKRREEELGRAAKIVEPVAEKYKAAGITTTHEVRYGHAGEIIADIAKASGAKQIFVGRQGSRKLTDRLLGGLTMALVQIATVPVTVVP